MFCYRWVEEDPKEILQSVITCMEKAVGNLKALNIPSDRIKCKYNRLKPFPPYQRLLMPMKYHIFESIMENGAFALLEQLLHIP